MQEILVAVVMLLGLGYSAWTEWENYRAQKYFERQQWKYRVYKHTHVEKREGTDENIHLEGSRTRHRSPSRWPSRRAQWR